jgi:hypothetical protein
MYRFDFKLEKLTYSLQNLCILKEVPSEENIQRNGRNPVHPHRPRIVGVFFFVFLDKIKPD